MANQDRLLARNLKLNSISPVGDNVLGSAKNVIQQDRTADQIDGLAIRFDNNGSIRRVSLTTGNELKVTEYVVREGSQNELLVSSRIYLGPNQKKALKRRGVVEE